MSESTPTTVPLFGRTDAEVLDEILAEIYAFTTVTTEPSGTGRNYPLAGAAKMLATVADIIEKHRLFCGGGSR